MPLVGTADVHFGPYAQRMHCTSRDPSSAALSWSSHAGSKGGFNSGSQHQRL
ncbi:pyridoxal phosphate biosynthetic protein [Xanthomonas oryzae pv. oryzae]|nr:pyridoxal phosphate biosynthetic protein [Xanthomonas oryzae pv. oryzae]